MPNGNPAPEHEMGIFVSSDVWVLLSIAIGDGGNGANLRDLIATGDYINHAIMTAQELGGGLARLTQVGYVEEISGRISLAGDAKTFWESMETSRRPVLRLWDKLEEFLEVSAEPSIAKNAQQTYPGVNAETVEVAYQEYLRNFWKTE